MWLSGRKDDIRDGSNSEMDAWGRGQRGRGVPLSVCRSVLFLWLSAKVPSRLFVCGRGGVALWDDGLSHWMGACQGTTIQDEIEWPWMPAVTIVGLATTKRVDGKSSGDAAAGDGAVAWVNEAQENGRCGEC